MTKILCNYKCCVSYLDESETMTCCHCCRIKDTCIQKCNDVSCKNFDVKSRIQEAAHE